MNTGALDLLNIIDIPGSFSVTFCLRKQKLMRFSCMQTIHLRGQGCFEVEVLPIGVEKWLSQQHENLSLAPRTHGKELGTVRQACKSSTGEAEASQPKAASQTPG